MLCVEIWGEKAGPFLQLLNFVSIFGFCVAPLIVRPFLSELQPPGGNVSLELPPIAGVNTENVTELSGLANQTTR